MTPTPNNEALAAEREAFEAEQIRHVTEYSKGRHHPHLDRTGEGYQNPLVHAAWQGWKARAALSSGQAATAVPEGSVLWFMANGWSVTNNPPHPSLTDEANVSLAWYCERTTAPYCCNRREATRRWFGASAHEALQASVADLGTKYPAIAKLADMLSPTQPASAPARERATLRERLQQRCSDWGVYWRASDAHGVDLSHEQALDLLRDALGVEVEIATPAAPAQPPAADNMPAWECIAMLLAEQDGQDPHHLIWEGNPPEPYGEVWCKYEFKARQIADLFATPPAPRAPSIEPDSVLASFKPMEREVLAQLAQEQEMSEAAVLRQALRIYQAVRLGAIKLQHPRPLGMMTFGAAPASQAESSTPRIEPVGEVERNAFDNWCRKRYPLADADDVADTFCDALWGCWQARAALATPTKSVSGVEEFPLPEARETAEPWGYATKAFGWGLVSKQVYDSVLASHGSDWAVKLYTTPPAPRAPSIEPVGEALERLTLWARTQVGRCECTGDHPIADAERALGWRK